MASKIIALATTLTVLAGAAQAGLYSCKQTLTTSGSTYCSNYSNSVSCSSTPSQTVTNIIRVKTNKNTAIAKGTKNTANMTWSAAADVYTASLKTGPFKLDTRVEFDPAFETLEIKTKGIFGWTSQILQCRKVG